MLKAFTGTVDLTDAEVKMKRVLAYTEVTSRMTFATHNTSPMTLTVAVDGNIYIKLKAVVPSSMETTAPEYSVIHIIDNATGLDVAKGGAGGPVNANDTSRTLICERRLKPSAGTHTYYLKLESFRNNSSCYIKGDVSPGFMIIENWD